MLDFLTWMNGTPWSVALRESLFVWPIVEAAHVVTLMLFVGTIIMVDLRLVGWAFTRVPVSEFDRRILPWTIAGFVLMLLTGLALFYAKPLVYYHSLFFRLKMLVLLFGLLNILLFHLRVQRTQPKWDTAARPPGAARAAGFFSLAVWAGVIVTGRLVAYDWYDCAKLDADGLLAQLASCPVTEAVQQVAARDDF